MIIIRASTMTMLRNFSRHLAQLIPWKGNHVTHKDLLSSNKMVAWGFLSQQHIAQLVQPPRIKLNTREVDVTSEEGAHVHTVLYGDHRTNPMVETIYNSLANDFMMGAEQAYRHIAGLFLNKSDFLLHDVTSPCMSMFLNDVIASYNRKNLEPRLEIKRVDAKLYNLRLEYGTVAKNRYIGGLMGREEILYHIMTGVQGPEATMISEAHGEGPRKLVAEVEYEVEEEFSLVDRATGQVVMSTRKGDGVPNKHYWTLESDLTQNMDDLEWVVCNVNDVVRPALGEAEDQENNNTNG